jgi:excisionase family DNA binding protein
MTLPATNVPLAERRALRIQDAAGYLSIGRTSLYALINAGKIQTTKVAGRHLVLRESLDRLLTPKTNP